MEFIRPLCVFDLPRLVLLVDHCYICCFEEVIVDQLFKQWVPFYPRTQTHLVSDLFLAQCFEN